MRKTRKEKRDERAEKVCREVRYQMATYRGVVDNIVLYNLLKDWMIVSNKNCYDRP